jgi:hypothetical protein
MIKIFNKLFTSLGLFWIGFIMLMFGLINFVLTYNINYWLSYIMIATMFIGLIMIAIASIDGDL